MIDYCDLPHNSFTSFVVNVVWNEWRQWSPCECIAASVRQTRNRTCRYPFNYQKNHTCLQVDAEERGRCQAVPGCRDGNWGAWHQWGRCECFGDVLQHRYKECDDPPPTNGGLNCVGVAPKESRACVTDECDNQPTEPRRTQAVTGPNDITTRTPMTQQSTVPGGLITDPDPATYDKGGVESTMLPHDLFPEASTAINVFVASISSNISIVGAVGLCSNITQWRPPHNINFAHLHLCTGPLIKFNGIVY